MYYIHHAYNNWQQKVTSPLPTKISESTHRLSSNYTEIHIKVIKLKLLSALVDTMTNFLHQQQPFY